MKTNNFFSKAAIGVLIVLCLAMTASQANAEPKIDSVSDTLGVMGQNLPITIRGSGFDANTRVSMSLDVGNMAFIKGSVNTGDGSRRVEISGNTAYVSTNSGVTVLDISNPAAPSIITTMGNIFDIRVIGNKAYFTQDGVFKVMDMSDPKSPKLIGSLSGVSGSITSISQNRAYLKIGFNDFEVIDLNTLSLLGTVNNLREMVAHQPCGAYGYTDTKVTAVAGDIAYVVSLCIRTIFGDSLYLNLLSLVDISNPSNPKILGTVELEGEINNITVSGNKAYVACGKTLTIVDIANPSALKKIGSVDTPGYVGGLAVINDKIYLADGNSGLQVMDVSDLSKLKVIASINTPGEAYSVAISGSNAYVADDTHGLQIIDIGELSNINMMSFVGTPNKPKDVAVIGKYAYLLYGAFKVINEDQLSGLKVIDVSIPSSPLEVEQISLLKYPKKIKFIKDIGIITFENKFVDEVYYTENQGVPYRGFSILDVKDPAHPKLIGQVTSGKPDDNYKVSEQVGNIVYYSHHYDTGETIFQIWDITNESSPVLLSSLPLDDFPNDVFVVNNTACIITRGTYMRLIDVSNPSNPIPINETVYNYDYDYIEDSVTIIGNTEYKVTEGVFRVSDISNPSSPVLIAELKTPIPAIAGTVSGSTAYISDATGMMIYPVPVEVKPVTLKSDTSISVNLPSPQIPGNYIIRVFNSTGGSELVGAVTFTDKYSMKNSKAIIVAGSGPSFNIWNPIKIGTDTAYKAMKSQGYDNDSIYYLSANPADVTTTCLKDTEICVDGQATYANLSYAINTWVNQNTPASELMIYFAGHGDNGIFQVNANEQLTVQDLDSWLDNLQTIMSGRVTFVYDACYSGSFVKDANGKPGMAPPAGKQRVVIASTEANNESVMGGNGLTSFSYFFWDAISTPAGLNIHDAFYHARGMIRSSQYPMLDANGNGISEEATDKSLASFGLRRQYGREVIRPKIESISQPQTLNGQTVVAIQATGVSSGNGNISRVWAEIMPPNTDLSNIPNLPTVTLSGTGTAGTYQGSFNFTIQGTYIVTVYAEDVLGSKAYPLTTTVTQLSGTLSSASDSFENDDSVSSAKIITINDKIFQSHNFNKAGDQDWIKFYARPGETYTIKALKKGVVCDPVIEIYNSDLIRIESGKQDYVQGNEKFTEWMCSTKGIYYVRFRNTDPNIFGSIVRYDVSVYQPYAPVSGQINGSVTDFLTKSPIGNVIINTEKRSAISSLNGVYLLENHPTGTYTLSAEAEGYQPFPPTNVTVTATGLIKIDISLKPANMLQKIELTGDMVFGNVPSGSTAEKILKISSTGSAPLNVSSIDYPLGFSVDWTSGTIAAGNYQDVTVTFAPTAMQNYSGTITVNSDKTEGVNTIPVTGAGVAAGYTISGYVRDQKDYNGVGGVTLTFGDTGETVITESDGSYSKAVSSGWSGTVTPSKSGCTFIPPNIPYSNITENKSDRDYYMSVAAKVAGDINDDTKVDLSDAIAGLQVLAGLNPLKVSVNADVNNDNRIGLEEVIYVLQKVAGLR